METESDCVALSGTYQGNGRRCFGDNNSNGFDGGCEAENIVIHVDVDATTGANNGTSWANAFIDLQEGCDAASTVAVSSLGAPTVAVWVAEGTYLPSVLEDPADPRTASFGLRNGVALLGGFSGIETAVDQRNPTLHPTILSGDIGVPIDDTDNCYHVVVGHGADPTAVLSGFTITKGRATGGSGQVSGGGLLVRGGRPTIEDCTFSDNLAADGGAIAHSITYFGVLGSDSYIHNRTFANNVATNIGGAIYNRESSPTIDGCTFSGNTALSGGAIFNRLQSDPLITYCSFNANTAERGGAMYNDEQSSPIVSHSDFVQNLATIRAGAVENRLDCVAAFDNCTFDANQSTGDGGAMATLDGSAPSLTSCTFTNNSAGSRGGAQYNVSSGGSATGCAFTLNDAVSFGGEVYNNDDQTVFDTCTFSGNSSTDDGGSIYNSNARNAALVDCDFTSNSTSDKGGAITNASSDVSISGCTFTLNSAVNWAGPIYNKSSNAAVTDSEFLGNQALLGGAVYNLTSAQPTFDGCTFDGNTAADDGGAIYNDNSGGSLNGCTFTTNSAVSFGGAIYNGASTPAVSDSEFLSNQANLGGALYNNTGSDASYLNCSFITNVGVSRSGGAENWQCSPSYTNCLFAGNEGASYGGAMANITSFPTLTNCTLYANGSPNLGGGIRNRGDSVPTIANSILWGNWDSGGTDESAQIHTDSGIPDPNVSYSCIEGLSLLPGPNNIGDDPLLLDPVGADGLSGTQDDDLHLPATSLSVDSGDNTAVPLGVTSDIEGSDRIADSDGDTIATVDRGVYELAAPVCGNGLTEFGEQCDGGDAAACPGQCVDCTCPWVCGNGVPEDGEECDDGDTDACGSCNPECNAPGEGSACGDGEVCTETEVCDDGYTDTCGLCNADCTGPGTVPSGLEAERLVAGEPVNAKNRFVSIQTVDTGSDQAIRVRFVDLPSPFAV